MVRLFEISDQIERVLAEGTDRETGEITEEALEALDELDGELAEKALNVACYIKGEKAEAAAVKVEADRLAERAKVHKRRADRLEGYLGSHLEVGSKYSDARTAIGWRKSSVVEVYDLDALPEEMRREVPARWEPDKKAIKEAAKVGIETPGARVETRHNLQIK